jgi:hypothetical protein
LQQYRPKADVPDLDRSRRLLADRYVSTNGAFLALSACPVLWRNLGYFRYFPISVVSP